MPGMRLTLVVALATICTGSGAAGQEPAPVRTGIPPRAIYIEAGGLPAFESGPYTLNFEQRLLPRTYLRLGIFYGPIDSEMTTKVPILLEYVTPGAVHNLEVGAGVRWDVSGVSSDEVSLGATIGYRYHELPGNALLRAGLNFDLHSLSGGDSDAWKFGPWPSLSIGFGF